MAGTEGQRKLLLHPSQKKQTNQHTNTKLITRNGTHTNILDTKYILENLATVVTSTESHTRELGYNLRACENFVACWQLMALSHRQQSAHPADWFHDLCNCFMNLFCSKVFCFSSSPFSSFYFDVVCWTQLVTVSYITDVTSSSFSLTLDLAMPNLWRFTMQVLNCSLLCFNFITVREQHEH